MLVCVSVRIVYAVLGLADIALPEEAGMRQLLDINLRDVGARGC